MLRNIWRNTWRADFLIGFVEFLGSMAKFVITIVFQIQIYVDYRISPGLGKMYQPLNSLISFSLLTSIYLRYSEYISVDEMHYIFVAIIVLISSVYAAPFDSIHSRDSGICGQIGSPCTGADITCCKEVKGFAFCNRQTKFVDFQPCKFDCGVISDSGVADCVVPSGSG